jgi:hypothetical protein
MSSWSKPSNLKPVGGLPIASSTTASAAVKSDGNKPGQCLQPKLSSSTTTLNRSQAGLPLNIIISAKPNMSPKDIHQTTTVASDDISSHKESGIVRTAAGKVWEDRKLSEWNESRNSLIKVFNSFLLGDFRLFVGNLGHDVTDQLLKTSFARFTSLSNVRVVKDSRTFKSKGYGFVAFSDPDDYLNAMKEMNGRLF